MSRRNWNPTARFASNGLLFGAVSFTTTNIGTDPDPTLFRGAGGLTGSDAATDVAVEGATFISSITKTANNGEFLVTFQDGYRFVQHADAGVSFPVAGPADGFCAQLGEFANEGLGHETPLTVRVTVLNAGGTPTETAGRRVRLCVVLKDSASGA